MNFYTTATSPKEVGSHYGEWLYDLVWYEIANEGSKRNIKNIHLIMESEWLINTMEIMGDFEKLIQGRSEHRVMIFQKANESEVKIVMDEFRYTICNYKHSQKGDRYIFAGYDQKNEKIYF